MSPLTFHSCRECGSCLAAPASIPVSCTSCSRSGHPLADIRGPESNDPLAVELYGWLAEECGEVVQRLGKLLRWGPHADYQGTTQRHKLEVEIGDVLAAVQVLVANGLIGRDAIMAHGRVKLAKLRLDAARGEHPSAQFASPRQLLRHARIPRDPRQP